MFVGICGGLDLRVDDVSAASGAVVGAVVDEDPSVVADLWCGQAGAVRGLVGLEHVLDERVEFRCCELGDRAGRPVQHRFAADHDGSDGHRNRVRIRSIGHLHIARERVHTPDRCSPLAPSRMYGSLQGQANQTAPSAIRAETTTMANEEARMLATFVIGLREGLEASLIVGIIAAFLKQSNRTDALRKVWLGVGAAVLLCLAVGVTLQLFSASLPQRQQEMLECVVAAIAVVMVSYMVLWMRKHSRDLKSDLQHATGSALARGSAGALVAMAFLAVLREGFETAVFLLAAFQSALSPVQAAIGVHSRRCGRGCARLPDLSRRREAQPFPLLPDHRCRAGAGRGRPGDEHAARRLRGRLADRRAADLAGSVGDRPAGFGAGVAADRHARHPLQPAGGRGGRLPAVRDPDAAGRAVAAETHAVPAGRSVGFWLGTAAGSLVTRRAARRASAPAAPAAVTGVQGPFAMQGTSAGR